MICKSFISLVFATGIFHSAFAQVSQPGSISATAGKEIFTTYCASCHALEAEEMGPRLGGVTRIYSQDELITFIKNPGAVIEKGNKRAAALARRYKMIMPPFDFLKEDEIKSIISYLDAETKSLDIQPLPVDTEKVTAKPDRLAVPITKSGLKIELEDFVTIPFSSDKMPRTRIAFTRPSPVNDGSMYVSDQRGLIYKIQDKQVTTFLDIRKDLADFINEPGLGTGLGSFAFHPDYLRNGLIYITHTEAFRNKQADYAFNDSIKVAMQWVVSEWKIKDVKSPVFDGTRRELFRINVPGAVHGIQEIAFQPDIHKKNPDYGLLYIGIGDGSSTISGYPELCHSLKSPLGTILRIDPRGRNSRNKQYGIPKDNPFTAEKDDHIYKEIYAFGFRNPHRMTWYEGKLFSSEVSESNFEELNLVVKGGDYGWNIREGNYGISSKDLKNVFEINDPDSVKLVRPFALYDHDDGTAISGGHVYDGSIKALKSKYVFGDIATGKLFYINMDKKLSDPTIHELIISANGKDSNLVEITGSKRVDVRIEYDRVTREMYLMTKPDGKIRRIKNAFMEAVK